MQAYEEPDVRSYFHTVYFNTKTSWLGLGSEVNWHYRQRFYMRLFS